MTYEDEQFDVLRFLHGAPRIIEDFHQSKQFWVEELGRGVYPRSLLDMLIDMDLVIKFRPYKSTEEETKAFLEELDLDGVSDERKALLAKYTSFRLTEFGKESYDASEIREVNVDDIESNIDMENIPESNPEERAPEVTDEPDETQNGMSEIEHNIALGTTVSEYEMKDVHELTPDPVSMEPESSEAKSNEADDMNGFLNEINMIEGDADDEEPEAQENIRLIQINEEISKLKKELGDAGFLSKRKIQGKIDDLEEERDRIERAS